MKMYGSYGKWGGFFNVMLVFRGEPSIQTNMQLLFRWKTGKPPSSIFGRPQRRLVDFCDLEIMFLEILDMKVQNIHTKTGIFAPHQKA